MREAGDAAICVGITDGTFSNGLPVELGIAAAHATQILLSVHESATDAEFLEELVRTHNGAVLRYSTPDNLVDQLCERLKLSNRQDPGGFIRSMSNTIIKP